jgi:hypothetical protein
MEQKGINENKKELKKGYIYSIRSFNTNKIYIGSTYNNLNKRFFQHKYCYKSYCKNKKQRFCSSYKILENKDAYIELIKEVHVNNSFELKKYEGEEQRKNKEILINVHQNNPTIEEYKAQVKKANEKFISENKDYYKKYYIQNKEHIKKVQSKKFNCLDCNIEILHKNRFSHFKSKKHKKNIENKENKEKIKQE